MRKFLILALLLSICYNAYSETWLCTGYCSCSKCCGKYSDGHFASGKKCYVGGCAVNWLPFGTKIFIKNLGTFTVEDRGCKKLFGDKNNHIKHVDIYFEKHNDALKFGKKFKEVIIY